MHIAAVPRDGVQLRILSRIYSILLDGGNYIPSSLSLFVNDWLNSSKHGWENKHNLNHSVWSNPLVACNIVHEMLGFPSALMWS